MAAGGGDDEATRFDLTALMDVLSNIIFFLMASFGAAVVAGLPASVPTQSTDSDDDPVAHEKDKVTVTLQVKADGTIVVKAENNELAPEVLQPLGKTIPPASGVPDFKALTDHLWGVKDKYRASNSVVIVPDDQVTYETLVQVMDASREHPQQVSGKWVYPPMFPAVTVSSLVKADPAAKNE